MNFPPIAIVGCSCVLPGALCPQELYQLSLDKRIAIGTVPRSRWRIEPRSVLTSPDEIAADRTWSELGGYVSGFDQLFDPGAFGRSVEEVLSLDVLFHWYLYAGRESMRHVPRAADISPGRIGLILGNLAYPTAEFSRYAESVWSDQIGFDLKHKPTAHPMNRFHSGQLASHTARCLGIEGPAFSLDAACASSIYAIKRACEELHDGRLDLVLAGGGNGADDLFLHIGFCALRALSKSGHSRPFSRDADGLIPAEGVAMVALKRLPDALSAGDRILGVIRGIGLSNDGSDGGFLTPSWRGQVRAMQQAYGLAGLQPSDISYVECHATGTPVGDGIEFQSMAELFAGVRNLAIGSLKSNLGHLLTASGAAGLVKILQAFAHRVLLPTAQSHPLRDEFHVGSQFRVLEQPVEWRSKGPRRAALNAFGFGGSNAHLIVEEWAPDLFDGAVTCGRRNGTGYEDPRAQAVADRPLAIVGLAAQIGNGANVLDFATRLFGGNTTEHSRVMNEIRLDPSHCRFPPRDLEQTLPQQLLALRVAQDAVQYGPQISDDATGVFVGMQCDAEVARYGMRWRLDEIRAASGAGAMADDGNDVSNAGIKERVAPALEAAAVVGTMPNILANRINVQLNLGGPGLTFSADELGGIRALQAAARALRSGELKAAIVVAVDLCCEPVHSRAARSVLPLEQHIPGDGAVAFVLKRHDDALSAGDKIYALLLSEHVEQLVPAALELRLESPDSGLTSCFGHVHAASGLIHVAAAVLSTYCRILPAADCSSATIWKSSTPIAASIHVRALGGQTASILVQESRAGSVAHSNESSIEERLLLLRRLIPQIDDGTDRRVLRFPAHLPALSPPPTVSSRGDQIRANGDRTSKTILRSRDVRSQEFTTQSRDTTLRESQRDDSPYQNSSIAEMVRNLSDAQRAYLQQVQAAQQSFLAGRARILDRVFKSVEHRGPASNELEATQPSEATAINEPARLDRQLPDAPKERSTAELRYQPTGPAFSRQQLEVLASGRISSVFGPMFDRQDEYRRQVRLPEPPLLLVDRVTGISAEPGVEGIGTIWTETDVCWDSWYVDQGVMPAGVMIEAGQADLLLISWMGADFHNRDRRVYRLLGCEATFHGRLPIPGETLRFEIRIKGHARQGDVRLFFFEYDCHVGGELRLAVRHGQAGFFSDRELAETDGVIWSPESVSRPRSRTSPPQIGMSRRTSFDHEQVTAFFEGRMMECFGAGFELAAAQIRPPRLGGRMSLFSNVSDFQIEGGPWNAGYLRATQAIQPDDWFFHGHFKNDPCMPGTLMAEGSLQAMAFFLVAAGYTHKRDGWRFEPVPGQTCKFECRGQVTPSSRNLIYEVFVEEQRCGTEPAIFADVLCIVDGTKAFHARRLALRLVPDWPLNGQPKSSTFSHEPGNVGVVDDVRGDQQSLLACAWGRPSEAFGAMYRPFDGARRAPRLPGPPYLLISRITRIEGSRGVPRPGTWVEAEYDVPPDAWYFEQNGNRTMPFCVLQEINLQPCGWLATLLGFTLNASEDVFFRNLDGCGTVDREVLPDCGTLRLRVEFATVSSFGGTTIVSFHTETFAGSQRICRFETSFGFFTAAMLSQQVGVPTSADLQSAVVDPSDFLEDLTADGCAYCLGSLRVPESALRMFDRITGYWPTAGKSGLGRVRAEQCVDPHAWYFKAHFFQDPVQAGSLGIQGMLNLLQFYMLHRNLSQGIENPQFEPIALDQEIVWKYRGQILPTNTRVVCDLQVLKIETDESGVCALATASLWVDGVRIYEVRQFGMRIVSGKSPASSGGSIPEPIRSRQEWILDARTETWLHDHCPTFTLPSAPLMWIADAMTRVACAAQPDFSVTAIENLRVFQWLIVQAPVKLQFTTTINPNLTSGLQQVVQIELAIIAPGDSINGVSPKTVATASVVLSRKYSPSSPSLQPTAELRLIESPYSPPLVFHGPAFQIASGLCVGLGEAVCNLDSRANRIPIGCVHPSLLDGVLHAVPHGDLNSWNAEIPHGSAAFPVLLQSAEFFSETPTYGVVNAIVRLERYDAQKKLAWLQAELCWRGTLWCRLKVAESLVPKGPFQVASISELQQFLGRREPVSGLRLSQQVGDRTQLRTSDVAALDWLPGTLAAAYRCDGPPELLTRQIAVKEHVASRLGVHPSEVDCADDGRSGRLRAAPHSLIPLRITSDGDTIIIDDFVPFEEIEVALP